MKKTVCGILMVLPVLTMLLIGNSVLFAQSTEETVHKQDSRALVNSSNVVSKGHFIINGIIDDGGRTDSGYCKTLGGVKVTIYSESKVKRKITGESGRFKFILPKGNYKIRCEKAGHEIYEEDITFSDIDENELSLTVHMYNNTSEFNSYAANNSLKVYRTINNKGILITYNIDSSKSKTGEYLVLNLTLSNIARTWVQIRRAGNLSVSDNDIPYVILLAPDGSRSFKGIKFNKDVSLLLQASKPASMGGTFDPMGDNNNLALAAFSLDLFSRGLLGKALPTKIYNSTQLDLFKTYATENRSNVLNKITSDMVTYQAKSYLKSIISNLVSYLRTLNFSSSTKDLINQISSSTVDTWSNLISTASSLFNLFSRGTLIWDLWSSTNNAPSGSSVEILVK